jgi:hypothetical protein
LRAKTGIGITALLLAGCASSSTSITPRSGKPSLLDLWGRLQVRRIFVEQEVLASVLASWLEGQRSSSDFDDDYLRLVRKSVV